MSVNLERDLSIRWKILCVYYDKMYSESKEKINPLYKMAKEENVDHKIITANAIFLHDENYLDSENFLAELSKSLSSSSFISPVSGSALNSSSFSASMATSRACLSLGSF